MSQKLPVRYFWQARRLLFSTLFALSVSVAAADVPPNAPASLAGVTDKNRARINYMLNCQGCHGPQAQGSEAASVPRMQGFVGNFLKVEGGREYLVQVPGSANASVSDAELAELLNWMIPTVSAAEMPETFVPYTNAEIARLRYSPEEDVLGTREKLIQAINSL